MTPQTVLRPLRKRLRHQGNTAGPGIRTGGGTRRPAIVTSTENDSPSANEIRLQWSDRNRWLAQVADLGVRTVRRTATRGRRDAESRLSGFRESGGRRARSTGMTAGSGGDAAGGPARHVPVLARAALEHLNVRDGGIYIDGTFGAGGYAQAILAAGAQVIGIDRDQTAIAHGAGLVLQVGRPAHAGRGPLLQSRRGGAQVRPRRGRRRRARHRRVVDAARRGASAASRSGSTGRSTCAWAATARAPPTWSRTPPSAISPTSSRRSARSALPAWSPAPSSRPAPRRRSRPPARSPTSSAAWCMRGPTGSIRRRGRSRRCASSSTRSWPSLPPALAAAERILKPGGRLVVVTFHSLEDRIVKTFLAERSGARSACRATRPRPRRRRRPSSLLTKRPIAAGRRRDRRQSARALGQAARRRAHRRAAARRRR